MTQGIGASGILGIAREVTPGTYVAPEKYVPFMSETLKLMDDKKYRRPIRQSADMIGHVLGNTHVEGDIDIEAFTDCIPYFMYASRLTVVKTGASAPFLYTGTPNANGVAGTTLSITIVRNGIVFAYVGCTVGQYTFTVGDDGELMYKVSIVGLDEAVQSSPSPTWPTTVPFGAGTYSVEIPTASQVFDSDTFEFAVNDNAAAEYRMKDTSRAASFVKFGEREATLKLMRDFDSRTDYDAFKAGTAQAVTVTATQDANNEIDIVSTTTVKDTYEVNIGGQGDLLRASISYNCEANSSGVPFTIAVTTTEDIT